MIMKMQNYAYGAASLVMMAGCGAAPALAQSAPATGQTAPASTGELKEIVVTAQKREQSLKDVPISMAALDSQSLESNKIVQLRDFVGQVPNLVVNNFNGRSDTVRLFLRGIGQNDVSATQDPSVALYVDGVYVGTTVGGGFETDDLERIEVLRGPQGTLYGRNATGGAVNIITNKPQLDTFSLKGSVGYGNYDAWRETGTVNVPLGDIAALRVSASHTTRDGLYKNTGPGADWSTQDHTAIHSALRVKPAAGLTIDYAFDYSLNKDTGTLTVPTAGAASSYPITAPAAVPGTGGAATMQTFFVNNFSTPSPFVDQRPVSEQALRPVIPGRGEVFGHSLALEWQVSDAITLRSITGMRTIRNVQNSDNLPVEATSLVTQVVSSVIPQLPVGTVLNTIGPNGVSYTTDTTRFHSISEELQLIGKSHGVEYVLGGYFYRDDAQLSISGAAIGSGPLILPNYTTVGNKTVAAFGEVTLHPFDEKLSLTLGGRYSHDERAATRINERSFSFAALGGFTADNCAFFARTFQALGQTCSPTGSVVPATYAHNFDSFSPSVTLAYKVNADLNLYAKFAQGYKSGGTSQRSANPTNFAQGFQPERVYSYEIGVKGNTGDHRLSYSLAGFYMKLNNYQASVQTGATAGDRDFLGISGNEIYGLEFDLNAALTRDLRVGVSGALLHTQFGAKSATVLLDTGATQVQNFINDFSYAPRESGNAYIDYTRNLGSDWRASFHGAVNYQSSVHTSSNVTDDRVIAGRALFDANVTLVRTLSGNSELSVQLWGKNLFDKQYKTVSYGSFAFTGATTVSEFGDPRTYGVTVGFKF